MVSFIITSKEKKKRQEYVKDYASKNAIDIFDITIIEKDSSVKTTQSIGIETVKLIQKKLFFKPIKSKNKLIVIEDAQLLTSEAQNALLKVLEEPPANTIIMLGTETREALLPTILSRCQIIELGEVQKELSDKTVEELTTFLQSLPELSVGGKLKQAEQLAKDKDKAIVWIENLILVAREELLSLTEKPNDKTFVLIAIIKQLQYLRTLMRTTNVNPRFAIENTLLNL